MKGITLPSVSLIEAGARSGLRVTDWFAERCYISTLATLEEETL